MNLWISLYKSRFKFKNIEKYHFQIEGNIFSLIFYVKLSITKYDNYSKLISTNKTITYKFKLIITLWQYIIKIQPMSIFFLLTP